MIMPTGHTDGTRRAAKRAAIASVSMALFLVALKIWASVVTGSVAMHGSLADTALDLIASLVTFFGVRWAAVPADSDHRFGHGKAEAIAAFIQVILITISALGIGWRAIDRMGTGARTEGLELGVGVSAVAILATFALLAYQRYVVRRTASVAIHTDHIHYQSDLFLNMAVIAALVLDQLLGWRLADPIFGLCIAAWLLYGAWSAASHSVDQLMDREWPAEEREAFLAETRNFPELAGLHDLRTASVRNARPVPRLGSGAGPSAKRTIGWTEWRKSYSALPRDGNPDSHRPEGHTTRDASSVRDYGKAS